MCFSSMAPPWNNMNLTRICDHVRHYISFAFYFDFCFPFNFYFIFFIVTSFLLYLILYLSSLFIFDHR